MARVITGLDIGSSHIRGLVVSESKEGKLAVISAFRQAGAGVRKGVVTDPDDFINVMRELIIDLGKISRQAPHNIFVNFQSEHIKARVSRGIAAVARADREIQEDDVLRVNQASQAVKLPSNFVILHNIVREYIVDDVGDIKNPVGMVGSRLEASTLLIEAFGPQIDTLVRCIEKAGGGVSGIIFNPLAASRAVLSKRQKDLGTILIDFGFGATSFVVYEEGKVMYTKSIPIGSGYLTNDVAIGLKTSIDVAEKLKLTYGFAFSRDVSRRDMIKLSEFDPGNKNEITKRFLSEIIEVRLAELLELINNELKSLGRNAQLPGGVIIVGGGAKLAGLNELIRHDLRLAVQTGFPSLEFFEIINPTNRDLIDDPEFATALGLVLWGREESNPTKSGGFIKNFLKNLMP